MTVLTVQAAPSVRVPMRLLALINVLWQVGAWMASPFSGVTNQREPQTVAEVLAWAEELQPTQPGFAADLRAAALAVQARGVSAV